MSWIKIERRFSSLVAELRRTERVDKDVREEVEVQDELKFSKSKHHFSLFAFRSSLLAFRFYLISFKAIFTNHIVNFYQMKTSSNFLLIIWVAILCSFSSLNAQAPEEIFSMAYNKSQTIESGYYEMTRKMKYMSHDDTTSNSSSCYFKKLPKDSLFGFAFYIPYNDSLGNLSSQLFFTGDELVRVSLKDSTATIKKIIPLIKKFLCLKSGLSLPNGHGLL